MLVPTTEGVSRNTFCHDTHTHTDRFHKFKTLSANADVAGKNYAECVVLCCVVLLTNSNVSRDLNIESYDGHFSCFLTFYRPNH